MSILTEVKQANREIESELHEILDMIQDYKHTVQDRKLLAEHLETDDHLELVGEREYMWEGVTYKIYDHLDDIKEDLNVEIRRWAEGHMDDLPSVIYDNVDVEGMYDDLDAESLNEHNLASVEECNGCFIWSY